MSRSLTKGRNWMQIRQDDDLRLTVPTRSKGWSSSSWSLMRRGEIPRGIAKIIRPSLEIPRVRAFCFRVADASASPLVREGIATLWQLEIADHIHAAKLCIQFEVTMTDNVLYGIDFSAKRDRQKLQGISQAMAPDEVFVDEDHNAGFLGNKRNHARITITCEMSIEERVRRSIYHSAGLPYPKDRA